MEEALRHTSACAQSGSKDCPAARMALALRTDSCGCSHLVAMLWYTAGQMTKATPSRLSERCAAVTAGRSTGCWRTRLPRTRRRRV